MGLVIKSAAVMEITESGSHSRLDGVGSGALSLRVVCCPDATQLYTRRLVLGELVVGRTADAWPVADRRMSGHHARFTRLPESGLIVEDLRSKNGTHVDGVQVRRSRLSEGSVVRLGDSIVVCEPDLKTADDRPLEGIVARAAISRVLLAQLGRAAATDLTVVLHGQSGTGKEVMAQLIHRHSQRRGHFQALNCGAIPPELIESVLFGHRRGAFTGAQEQEGVVLAAEGGTLFLDEVAELPARAQVALLRVLEEREVTPVGATRPMRVDVRVVCATHVDLRAAVDTGAFRLDLYSRLAEWTIVVPPLSERRVDIPALARHFLGEERVLSADATEALLLHGWPMNVRELRAVTRRAAAEAGDEALIRLKHLPAEVAEAVAHRTTQPALGEKGTPNAEALRLAIDRFDGNLTAVAAYYGKHRKQVYRWLHRHGIERPQSD